MQAGDFFQRFTDAQEIGRDVTDTHLLVFYDNGAEVGLWRELRATTVGDGSVLAPADAEMARYWFSRENQQRITGPDASPEDPRPGRRLIRSIGGPAGARRR